MCYNSMYNKDGEKHGRLKRFDGYEIRYKSWKQNGLEQEKRQLSLFFDEFRDAAWVETMGRHTWIFDQGTLTRRPVNPTKLTRPSVCTAAM